MLNCAIVDQLDRVAPWLIDLQVSWLKAQIDTMDIQCAKR